MTTNQRLPDQVRKMIKKDWFSDLQLFEIHQKINRESKQQDSNTIIDTLNTEETRILTEISRKLIKIQQYTPKLHRTNIRRRNECRKFKENDVLKD